MTVAVVVVAYALCQELKCSRRAPGYFTHLPHAIVVRLHRRKSNVVILTPVTVDAFGV